MGQAPFSGGLAAMIESLFTTMNNYTFGTGCQPTTPVVGLSVTLEGWQDKRIYAYAT
jgi:hypothetical protein